MARGFEKAGILKFVSNFRNHRHQLSPLVQDCLLNFGNNKNSLIKFET